MEQRFAVKSLTHYILKYPQGGGSGRIHSHSYRVKLSWYMQ